MSDSFKSSVVTNQVELPSKVEVTKNSKGYTWTISMRCEDGKEVELINKLDGLNKEMHIKFKEKENENGK